MLTAAAIGRPTFKLFLKLVRVLTAAIGLPKVVE